MPTTVSQKIRASKLSRIINSLSHQQKNRLDQYIGSPYFNDRKEMNQLYQLDSAETLLDDRTLFQRLFPKKRYNNLQLRHLRADLMKHIENFLAIEQFQKDKEQKSLYVLKALRKLKLERYYLSKAKKTIELDLESMPVSLQRLQYDYLINEELYDFNEEQGRSASMNMQQFASKFDTYYIAVKLKMACNMLVHQRMYKHEYDVGLIKEIMKYVDAMQLTKDPLIFIYYNYYKALTEIKNDLYFEEIKKKLSVVNKTFEINEKRDVYLMLINFCIRKFTEGDTSYIHQVFSIYQSGLKEDALIIKGKLTPYTFKNIISAGLYLEQFEWTEQFINDFRNKIDAKDSKSIVDYNLAHLHYRKGDFKTALQMLQTTKIKDLYLRTNARVLQIKMFYVMGDYALADSWTTNFRLYLKREKMMDYHKDNYNNFRIFMNKLLEWNQHDKEETTRLRREINETKVLSEKEWFLKMVDGEKNS